MKNVKTFPKLVIAIGVIFALIGVGTIGAGVYMNSFVGEELAEQGIVTPDDASIPNTPVTNIPTALSMANIIREHSLNYSGGLSYAEMGRFATESGDPAGTSNRDEALLDANGAPVANPARNTQLTASGLITSLTLAAMALGLSYGVMAMGVAFLVLGAVIGGLGYALLGLITPEVASKFGLQPVTAK